VTIRNETIPGAVARAAPSHGHISLITTFRDAIVDDLLARAGRTSQT